MPELTAEERRRNVERVREAGERLEMLENYLTDLLARAPGVLREVQDIRQTISGALAGAPAEKEQTDDA